MEIGESQNRRINQSSTVECSEEERGRLGCPPAQALHGQAQEIEDVLGEEDAHAVALGGSLEPAR